MALTRTTRPRYRRMILLVPVHISYQRQTDGRSCAAWDINIVNNYSSSRLRVRTVLDPDLTVGSALLDDPKVPLISATGSTRMGRIVDCPTFTRRAHRRTFHCVQRSSRTNSLHVRLNHICDANAEGVALLPQLLLYPFETNVPIFNLIKHEHVIIVNKL